MPEKGDIPRLDISGIPASLRAVAQEIKKQAHRELLVRLNLKKLALSGISEEELNRKAAEMVKEILGQLSIELPAGLSIKIIEKELIQETIGLGPLENLISRDDITEIMVNAADEVFVENGGVIYRTDTAFADDAQVLSAIERIVSPLGRRIDESSPMVDARLPDGSRVNIIIPPLSLIGPCISIRKFTRAVTDSDTVVRYGDDKPGISNLMSIYSCFTGKDYDAIQREFEGRGYGDFKLAVGETCADALAPVQASFNSLLSDKGALEAQMKKGAEEASYYARRTLSKVQKKLGFVQIR